MSSFADFDSLNRRQTRRNQVLADLKALDRQVNEWLEACRLADIETGAKEVYVGRHETQLKTVQTVLLGVLADLQARAGQIALKTDPGAVHEECRRLSTATVWFERLWDYVRSRFAQRFGTGERAALVRAADEVVWSCYRPVFKNLAAHHPARLRSVAPLAYVEPEYSPAAMQFDRPLPAGLRLVSGDATLDSMLDRLPISTLRLPPWTVTAPWWLVFVAHEVGHHVQHELDLVKHVADGVGEAARAAGLSDALSRKWEAWAEEIFADAFSVLMIGPLAARAVSEVEWSAEPGMAQRKVHYPAPIIRIALMTALAERLGLENDQTLALAEWQAMAQRHPTTAEDWPAIAGTIDFLLAPLPDGLPPLAELCDFKAAPYAEREQVHKWTSALQGKEKLAPRSGLVEARLMASAAFAAWSELASRSPDDVERETEWKHLLSHASGAIRACSEPGKRAGGTVEIDPGSASALSELMLGTPLDARVANRGEA